MNDNRELIMDNLEQYLLSIDDTFHFKCRACGKCCKNREDIILTARDLYNIAKKLGMTHETVMEKYCDRYIGRDSQLPVVRLQPVGVNHVCPFLADKRCMVHDSKPVVCALFPIGRVRMNQDIPVDNELKAKLTGNTFIMMPVTCGSISRKHTVRSWLEKFGIPTVDEFFESWTDLLIYLCQFTAKLGGMGISEELMMTIWQLIGFLLYGHYDTTKEFMPQYEENVSALKGELSKVMALYETELKKLDGGGTDD